MTAPTPTGPSANESAVEELVAESRVVICCGSGGVGKTTIAAVLALEGARRGRNTCVVTISAAPRSLCSPR